MCWVLRTVFTWDCFTLNVYDESHDVFLSGKLVSLSLGGCSFDSALHLLMVKWAKIRDMKHPFREHISFMVDV